MVLLALVAMLPALPLGAVVVRRAPLPPWLALSPVVVGGLLGGTHPERTSAKVVLVALMLTGWIVGGAAVGSWIRAGAPTAPWPRWRAAPLLVTTSALSVGPLLGFGSLEHLPLWLLSAAAVACRLRGGGTAEATGRAIATGVLILSALALLFPRGDPDLGGVLGGTILVVHAAGTRWAVGGAAREGWLWAIGLGPALIVWCGANAPAAAVELGARWAGAWDDLPAVDDGVPLDCAPTLTPGPLRSCRTVGTVTWTALHAPATDAAAAVARTARSWPPRRRVVAVEVMFAAPSRDEPVVTLLGPIAVGLGAHAIGSLSLVGAGRPQLRIELVAAHVVPVSLLCALFGAASAFDGGREAVVTHLLLGGTVQLAVLAASALPAALRARSWGLAAAVAAAPLVAVGGTGLTAFPREGERQLVAFGPLPRGPARNLWSEARCAWTASGTVDIATGSPCSAPEGWYFPPGAAVTAAVLREDLGAVAMRREGWPAVAGWRSLTVAPTALPAGDEVPLLPGDTVEALLERCGDASVCRVRLPP